MLAEGISLSQRHGIVEGSVHLE